MRVIVDADACPGLSIVLAECRRLQVPVTTVASYRHAIDSPDHVMVGPEKEAADLAILNRVQKGDLVITQDWGLAALALARGARALSPWGHIFRPEEMEGRLAQRALHARLRRAGVRLKGPARRTAGDDQRLRTALTQLIQGQDGA